MKPQESTVGSDAPDPMPFGAADLRLTGKQWLVLLGFVVPALSLTPWLWARLQHFETGPDYRLPYALSRDYWLYSQRVRQVAVPKNIILVGDSVVWGEYVRPDGTWSHFLNRGTGSGDRFINGGVNGMFPLALEGLVRHYAPLPRGQKVLLHCNLLWMTSPQADLSSDKEEHFNHSRLVPQFRPRIPCYRADANERLGALIQNRVPFLAWVDHLQDAYFDQRSLPGWTLADDGSDPPHYPHALANPLAQVSLTVPPAPDTDPQRGPDSPRHRPWSKEGKGDTRFEWVDLDASMQWAAFQRLVGLLQDRGNDVFVVVGPFNEHKLVEGNRPAYRKIRDGIAAWLVQRQIPHWVPEALPSPLYADASHPLTAGYELLAQGAYGDAGFRHWTER